MKSTPPNEHWTPVVGYERYYEVSDQGRVSSLDRLIVPTKGVAYWLNGRILSQTKNRRGYYRVALWRGNKGRTREVHKLVAGAFLGKCPNGKQVRHLDGTRTNNNKRNLKYGTPLENQHDRERHGTKLVGEQHPMSRFSDQRRAEIVLEYKTTPSTMRSVSNKYGVSASTLWRWVHV